MQIDRESSWEQHVLREEEWGKQDLADGKVEQL